MNATINGLRIAFEVQGDGPPVVFVHGFPLTGALWTHCIGPLRDAYRVIVPDLRGLGASEAVDTASMGDYAADLAALLDHLGETRPAVLVGHSMGGYVCMAFARRHRDRLRALVLVDTRADADTAAKRQERTKTAKSVLAEGSVIVADAMLGSLFAPSASESLRSQWGAMMAASDRRGVAAALQAMAERPDSMPDLSRCDVATLIVVGQEDAITPPIESQRMHEAMAGSQMAIIPGAGHMTPVESPDDFARIVLAFLDRLPAT